MEYRHSSARSAAYVKGAWLGWYLTTAGATCKQGNTKLAGAPSRRRASARSLHPQSSEMQRVDLCRQVS